MKMRPEAVSVGGSARNTSNAGWRLLGGRHLLCDYSDPAKNPSTQVSEVSPWKTFPPLAICGRIAKALEAIFLEPRRWFNGVCTVQPRATEEPRKPMSIGGPRDGSAQASPGKAKARHLQTVDTSRLTRLSLQLTVIRVPAWVPFTSCRRFPLGS